MIALVKPILFAFIKTTAVKELIVKLLEAYAKSTDNTVDDKLVELVKKNLLGCLLYTSPSPRDVEESRMPSSA